VSGWDGSHYRWGNHLDKMRTIIMSRHSDARLIILVNDTYDPSVSRTMNTTDGQPRELLQQVGERPELRDEVKAAIKTFVLHTMYSEKAGVTCGQARASKWHKMKKKAHSASRLMTTR